MTVPLPDQIAAVDPFRIDGPALIQFSGGRTSAYMLWRILQAHGGTLPADVIPCFQNTGREMPETLDFVRDCAERWGSPVRWIEYRPGSFAEVDHSTASRNGEPFDAMLAQKKMLPNPVMRFCTIELKIRPSHAFARALGWDDYASVKGLRADEPQRVAKARQRAEARKDGHDTLMPLAAAGITKRDVGAFWARQNWGLDLPSINGTTPMGNCDLCFLKAAATIAGIMRDRPETAAWWIAKEAKTRAAASYFRADRPSYAVMLDAVQRQEAFDFGASDQRIDCHCMEDA